MMRVRTNKEFAKAPVTMLRIPSKGSKKELPRLLIVDDDEQVLRVSVRLLCRTWQIQTAHSAKEAAHYLQMMHFDAILTDFEMPNENGLWLLAEVRALQPNAKRVLFSGSGPRDLFVHLQSGLVHDFVSKPTSREALLTSLSGNAKHCPN